MCPIIVSQTTPKTPRWILIPNKVEKGWLIPTIINFVPRQLLDWHCSMGESWINPPVFQFHSDHGGMFALAFLSACSGLESGGEG